MAGDDDMDDDVFGDDDDVGRGANNWGTCKGPTVRVHAPLLIQWQSNVGPLSAVLAQH